MTERRMKYTALCRSRSEQLWRRAGSLDDLIFQFRWDLKEFGRSLLGTEIQNDCLSFDSVLRISLRVGHLDLHGIGEPLLDLCAVLCVLGGITEPAGLNAV